MTTPTTPNEKPAKSLVADIARMLPVWAIVFVTVAGALFVIRGNGARYIASGIYSQRDTCQVAEIRYEAGRRIWRELLGELGSGEAAQRGRSSLGKLKGDERIDRARRELLAALTACPRIRGPHDLLSGLAWMDGNAGAMHYHMGMEHVAAREWDEALAEFRAAAEIVPELDEYQLALAEMASRRGQWEEAGAAMDRLGGSPLLGSAGALRVRAMLAARDGEQEEALAAWRQALEADPGHAETVRSLYQAYWSREDKADGARFIEALLDKAQAPEAESYHLVSMLFLETQNYEPAVQAIDKAIAIAPNNIYLQFDKAIMLHRLGDHNGARNAGEKAMSMDPVRFWEKVDNARFNPLDPESTPPES